MVDLYQLRDEILEGSRELSLDSCTDVAESYQSESATEAERLVATILKASIKGTSARVGDSDLGAVIDGVERSTRKRNILGSDSDPEYTRPCDQVGFFAAIDQHFKTRHGEVYGHDLATMFIPFITDEAPFRARLSKEAVSDFNAEVNEMGINPFADFSLAFVGGGDEMMPEELPITGLFEYYHNFRPENPSGWAEVPESLQLSSAAELLGDRAVSAVVSGNVICGGSGFVASMMGSNIYMTTDVFSACANILKIDGVAVHITETTPAEPIFWDKGLWEMNEVRQMPVSYEGVEDRDFSVFKKTSESQVSSEQAYDFTRRWIEKQHPGNSIEKQVTRRIELRALDETYSDANHDR